MQKQNRVSIYTIAKQLRRNMTLAEKILWEKLKNNQLGVKFRRQTPFIFKEYRYIADFCCYSLKLIIELDGGIHDIKGYGEYDEFRQEVFTKASYRVIRFKNDEVINDIKKVIDKIKQEIKN